MAMKVKRTLWLALVGELHLNHLVEGKIVINEIMLSAPRATDPSTQWFELYNTEATTRSMRGWTVSYVVAGFNEEAIDVVLETTKSIGPFGYLVIGNNANTATNGGVTVDIPFNFEATFPKDGKGVSGIRISLSGTAEEDFIEWDTTQDEGNLPFPSSVDNPGASIYKVSAVQEIQTVSNWKRSNVFINCDGVGSDKGTPGKINTYVCPKKCGLFQLSIFCLNGCGVFGRRLGLSPN
jgi:uncharacterized protein